MSRQRFSGKAETVVSLLVAAGLIGSSGTVLAAGEKLGEAGRSASWHSAEQGSPSLEDSRLRVQSNPQDAAARNDLGWALRQSGDLAGAEGALREAIKLNPNMPQAHSNLSVVLSDKKILPEAVTEARTAVSLDPLQPIYHVVLGNALVGQGDPKSAVDEYRQAIAQKPDYENARFHLGQTLYRLGDVTAAKVELSYALKLDPDDVRALELMDKIMSGDKQPAK